MIILIGIVTCVIISLITSFLFPDLIFGNGTVSTLYTVSGIMFSIGMSLIVTSSAAGVKNTRIKKALERRYVKFEIILLDALFLYLFSTFYYQL